MKRITTGLICIIAATTICRAQTINYYEGRDTVYGKKVRYVNDYKTKSSSFGLENAENDKEYYKFPTFKNGDPLETYNDEFVILPRFYISPKNEKQMYRAMFKAFTRKELGRMYAYRMSKNGGPLIASVIILPNTEIAQVMAFSIPNVEEFTSIPPDKYFKLEQKIKKYIKVQYSKDVDQYTWTYQRIHCLPGIKETNKRFKRLADKYGDPKYK